MSRCALARSGWTVGLALAILASCRPRPEPLEAEETFHWVPQPIAFSPPAPQWERQGDNGGGMLGVRFILRGGGGQCISVAAHRRLADRDRSEALATLLENHASMTRREVLRELSLARPISEEPLSDREADARLQINTAIDRAIDHSLADRPRFLESSIEMALQASAAYAPTLEEIVPWVRLQPERMNEPERWRLGSEHDTTLAGTAAFATEDTLLTPERPLLYHEIFWVVRGCAFKATFQGTRQRLPDFHRLVGTIRFPEVEDATP